MIGRKELLQKLLFIQYIRNDVNPASGTIQVRGNTVMVNLPYQKDTLRIELFGDQIEGLQWVNKQNHTVQMNLDNTIIFPAKHFVTPPDRQEAALAGIKRDLDAHLPTMKNDLYRERLSKRVSHDLEMLREIGYCSGIENYSSYFEARESGAPPSCLFDFFPEDFLLIIDESHIALPQMRGMYAGDRARKSLLVEFGFRLPSAFDNRPLKFEEAERHFKNVIFVSATPSEYELTHSDNIVEQIIRPTGLLDPEIELHGRPGQMDHLLSEIQKTTNAGHRSLVMVMTKKLAEDMAKYLEGLQIKVAYLHSDLKTPQRTELLQKLRLGVFDCLVGVNLLREGIDLPEVALVAIMDADLESFLRDKRSLIQIIGRAARNTEARVILYADKITKSMKDAMEETSRRRTMQEAYNTEHGITPRTVKRDVIKSIVNIQEMIDAASKSKKKADKRLKSPPKDGSSDTDYLDTDDILTDQSGLTHKTGSNKQAAITKRLIELERLMQEAAEKFDFETAIALRKEWYALQGK